MAKLKASPRFIVVTVTASGSGTLTFPEDFNVLGVFSSEADANHEAHLHNQHLLITEMHLEPNEVLDMTHEEVQDAINDCCDSDFAIAHVMETTYFNNSKKAKARK